MRRWLVVLLIAISPLAAKAQQVTVRSGDHEDFTRLVFNLPSRVEWSIEPETNGVLVRFGTRGLSFETGTVFERIQRDRLADIEADSDTQSVTLRFACNCEAKGFWFRRSMLVIDVAPKDDREPDKPLKEQGTRDQLALQLPMRGTSPARDLVHEAIGFNASEGDAEAHLASPLMRGADLVESRDRLLREFSRATSQGLLSPKRSQPRRIDRDNEVDNSASTETEPIAPEPGVPDPTSNLNINAQTSIDRDFLDALEVDADAGLSNRCLDGKLLDVASWGTEQPFWEQIGPLRAQMTIEFDRIDERAVRQLAEVYLFFGFGAEAREIAALLPQGQLKTRIYKALAEIMNAGSAEGSILANQLDCDAPGAMWSALSHPELPAHARLDKDAILRAFSALPPHLRKHLGPILSARLLAAGHTRQSAAIVRILDRNDATMTPEATMVAADLQAENGEPEAAEENLGTVVEANGEVSPEALAKQIDSRIARGGQVSPDLAQLASAYAYEHAGTELGNKLARSHVLALGASGAFDDAFSELDRLEADAISPLDDIRADLTDRLASHGAPVDILRHVLSGKTAQPDTLSQESALSLATHLLEAGFYEHSQDMLVQTFHGRNAREARLIRAKTALKLEQPRLAEVELLGLDGVDVNVLRAQARSMVGEHRQAYELFKSAGMQEEASREAWLAGDGLDQAGQDATDDTSDLESLETETGHLAQNKVLLEDSGATRDSLQALLSEAPEPSPDN